MAASPGAPSSPAADDDLGSTLGDVETDPRLLRRVAAAEQRVAAARKSFDEAMLRARHPEVVMAAAVAPAAEAKS